MKTSRTFGFDNDGKYDGTKKYFWAFHSHLEDILLKEGLAQYIENRDLEPLAPEGAIHRQQNLIGPAPGEFEQLEKYHEKMRKYEITCGKTHGIIKNLLGPAPLSSVRTIIDNSLLSNRQKAQQIMARLMAIDGAPTETVKSELEEDIMSLPPAVDAQSAIDLISGITHLNAILTKLQGGHTDAALRTKLFRKLKSPMFDTAAAKINSDPTMTFPEAC